MALTYLAPPLLALFASGTARILGLAAWGLMAIAFQPTLRLYRLSPLWGLGAAGDRRSATCCSRSIPPCNSRAAKADSGRAAIQATGP